MAGLPPSPPFNNPVLAGFHFMNTAAVNPGDMDMAGVGRETRRKVWSAVFSGITHVEDAEIGMAAGREAEAISQVHGNAIAPMWFNQALAAALNPIQQGLNGLQNQVNGLQNQVNGLQNQVNGLQNQVNGLDAHLQLVHHQQEDFQTHMMVVHANSRIFARNLAACAVPTNPFQRPAKLNRGYLAINQLPNAQLRGVGIIPGPIHAIFNAPAPDPGPNVFPPDDLPFAENYSSNLTSRHIGYLCRWYNDTFGIEAGDNHTDMMRKLKCFLTGK
ncbi:hypothetical protein AC1031_016091 [Aphanomyces cochlioides]|nr:hypothetical protein AC1031_016091 [Aphanomyces cochlioides]